MKISIISESDSSGGAARAAYRLHRSLINNEVKSQLLVNRKLSDDFTVINNKSKWLMLTTIFKIQLSSLIQRIQKTKNPIIHSINFFGSELFKRIQNSNADIVNLHWINQEALSIKQISKINKPIVMTLHDMWAFCGSEHLSIDSKNSQFRLGYQEETIASDFISGINLNKYIWLRKKKNWVQPFTIITPSSWLTRCARESVLFSSWDIRTIPNTLDTTVFRPVNKTVARELLKLPIDKKLIGFGAMKGGKDPNKGFDLLKKSLLHLSEDTQNGYECVIFGQSLPENKPELGLPVKFIGHLNDDITLALFYSAMDVMVVPSRQENLPQTATESQSCGTPVIAFNTTGLPDTIEHKVTGYLAIPFETQDLAKGIEWCIEKNKDFSLSTNARERAVRLWSFDIIAKQYIQLYSDVINNSKETYR
jgi:glycosyltransferase involved in cell wall biosynthesis